MRRFASIPESPTVCRTVHQRGSPKPLVAADLAGDSMPASLTSSTWGLTSLGSIHVGPTPDSFSLGLITPLLTLTVGPMPVNLVS